MKPRMESNTSSPTVVGVDIGKDVFHLVGFGGRKDCVPEEDQTTRPQRRF